VDNASGVLCRKNPPAKIQEESNRRFRIVGDVTFYHVVFTSVVIVFGESENMLPFLVRRIIVPVDGTVNVQAVPMMGESPWADL
jgi:hypothetical protein